jgi:hypothetical protein
MMPGTKPPPTTSTFFQEYGSEGAVSVRACTLLLRVDAHQTPSKASTIPVIDIILTNLAVFIF